MLHYSRLTEQIIAISTVGIVIFLAALVAYRGVIPVLGLMYSYICNYLDAAVSLGPLVVSLTPGIYLNVGFPPDQSPGGTILIGLVIWALI